MPRRNPLTAAFLLALVRHATWRQRLQLVAQLLKGR